MNTQISTSGFCWFCADGSEHPLWRLGFDTDVSHSPSGSRLLQHVRRFHLLAQARQITDSFHLKQTLLSFTLDIRRAGEKAFFAFHFLGNGPFVCVCLGLL